MQKQHSYSYTVSKIQSNLHVLVKIKNNLETLAL